MTARRWSPSARRWPRAGDRARRGQRGAAAPARPGRPGPAPERVSVLLPLRDEARRVARLPGARCWPRTASTEVLVLDDGSTDGTAEIARASPATRGPLLTGRPLPAGWLGKPHACQQLADAADPAARRAGLPRRRRRARARTRSPPPSRCCGDRARPGLARTRGIVAGTAAERLVQPLLQWSWLTFLPLRLAERSPRPSLAAADGQLLAVRRAAYDRAGGHAAVRGRGARGHRAGCGRSSGPAAAVGVADGTALADLPDVRRLGRAARRLHQVAVGGVRLAAPARPRSPALLAAARTVVPRWRPRWRGSRCRAWPDTLPGVAGRVVDRPRAPAAGPGPTRSPTRVSVRRCFGWLDRRARWRARRARHAAPGRAARCPAGPAVSRVVVVGAGVGGLAAAARLAAAGHEVTVCEQAPTWSAASSAGSSGTPRPAVPLRHRPVAADPAAGVRRPVRGDRRPLAGRAGPGPARPADPAPLRRRHRAGHRAATWTCSAPGSTPPSAPAAGADWRRLAAPRRADLGGGPPRRSSSRRSTACADLARLAVAARRPARDRARPHAALARPSATCATRGSARCSTGTPPTPAPTRAGPRPRSAAVPYVELSVRRLVPARRAGHARRRAGPPAASRSAGRSAPAPR